VEGLCITREIGFGWIIAQYLAAFAALAAVWAQPDRAVRLAGAALALSDVVGIVLIPLSQGLLDDALASVRPGLDEKAFATAWAAGTAMSVTQATDEALAIEGQGGRPGTVSGQASTTLAPDAPSAGSRGRGLSQREVEVLRLIAGGRTNKQIAEALAVSIPTVERHVTHIYGKIGAHGRAGATAYALKHRLA
jgi:DNA-binding NarL/FixJ family response regulator